MENCPVCGKTFNGKNAQTVLLRHLRDGNPAHQEEHKLVIPHAHKTPSQLKRERDTRYKEKNPEQAQATKHFSKIKRDLVQELTKQHEDVKPQLLLRPQSPPSCGVHESNNRYLLLEDHLHIFAGRRQKLYSWAQANQVCRRCVAFFFFCLSYCGIDPSGYGLIVA